MNKIVFVTTFACIAAFSMAMHTRNDRKQDDSTGDRDLVFMHIPYNFGHTIEQVAMVARKQLDDGHAFAHNMLHEESTQGISNAQYSNASMTPPPFPKELQWAMVGLMKQVGGEVWGHWNPEIQKINTKTGCSLFFTPQKYWDQADLDNYFGNKTVFGMLRDPYERLVAMFRGNFQGYGGFDEKFHAECDVNGALQTMLRSYKAGDQFASECTFLPQAEYFDGPYGVKLPIDNLLFPTSMNEVFAKHSYDNMHITTPDIIHVRGCDDVWAADLNAETKQLIQEVYARDFDLLCENFGYCDKEANVCLTQVPYMCPPKQWKWDPSASPHHEFGQYVPA